MESDKEDEAWYGQAKDDPTSPSRTIDCADSRSTPISTKQSHLSKHDGNVCGQKKIGLWKLIHLLESNLCTFSSLFQGRHLIGQQNIDRDCRTPNICHWIVRLTSENFGGDILLASDSSGKPLFVTELVCIAEVGDSDPVTVAAFPCDNHILQFNVTMADFPLVKVV